MEPEGKSGVVGRSVSNVSERFNSRFRMCELREGKHSGHFVRLEEGDTVDGITERKRNSCTTERKCTMNAGKTFHMRAVVKQERKMQLWIRHGSNSSGTDRRYDIGVTDLMVTLRNLK